jgi:hypothetical protein
MTIPDYEICDCGKRGPHSECSAADAKMKDPINHKPDCRPALRKTQIIAPVIGMRCLNCGGETERREGKMKDGAMKELSIMLAEIEAIKTEVEGMKVTNLKGVGPTYWDSDFYDKADQIRAIIDKMRRIDTRPGVS